MVNPVIVQPLPLHSDTRLVSWLSWSVIVELKLIVLAVSGLVHLFIASRIDLMELKSRLGILLNPSEVQLKEIDPVTCIEVSLSYLV